MMEKESNPAVEQYESVLAVSAAGSAKEAES